MTDNNVDETDGQNSNLSRRTALALMGTSAVGGAAATGAFSELTADRPIDAEVVSSGGDSETADSGSSELQITNNDDMTIDVEITTTDSDVSLVGTTGSSGASVSGGNPWTLTGLSGSGTTATIEFARLNSSSSMDFDVEAFSSTNGFSINSSQAVSVARGGPASGVSRWTFNTADTNSGTVIDGWGSNDGSISSNGVTTGVTGANQTYTTNEAYDFDGIDGIVTVPDSDSLTSDGFSVSYWVKIDVDDGNYRQHVGKWNDGESNHREFVIGSSNTTGKAYFGVSSEGGSPDQAVKASLPSIGSWAHIVALFDPGNEIRYYRDADLKASASVNISSIYNGPADVGIGAATGTFGGSSNKVEGQIDDVRFYNKPLTSTEVSNLYNTGTIQG